MMYVLAILENEEGKFLATQRALDKKWPPEAGKCLVVGLRVKESSLDAIKREVKRRNRA